MAGSCEHGNKHSGLTKAANFLTTLATVIFSRNTLLNELVTFIYVDVLMTILIYRSYERDRFFFLILFVVPRLTHKLPLLRDQLHAGSEMKPLT